MAVHYYTSAAPHQLHCFDTANFLQNYETSFLEKMIACLFVFNIVLNTWGHIATVPTYSSGNLSKCWEKEQLLFSIV